LGAHSDDLDADELPSSSTSTQLEALMEVMNESNPLLQDGLTEHTRADIYEGVGQHDGE
jgi:hypothetical protein